MSALHFIARRTTLITPSRTAQRPDADQPGVCRAVFGPVHPSPSSRYKRCALDQFRLRPLIDRIQYLCWCCALRELNGKLSKLTAIDGQYVDSSSVIRGPGHCTRTIFASLAIVKPVGGRQVMAGMRTNLIDPKTTRLLIQP